MGVFLRTYSMSLPNRSLPHVRGGVSGYAPCYSAGRRSSPRAWGCFFCVPCLLYLSAVFPTCVGVFLTLAQLLPPKMRLPHVRGGVSEKASIEAAYLRSSPRAWGCFPVPAQDRVLREVFPTCVGVFPGIRCSRRCRPRLPHVRGGVSGPEAFCRAGGPSSPRAWGCF